MSKMTFNVGVPESVEMTMNQIRSLFSNEEGGSFGKIKKQSEYDYMLDMLKDMKGKLKTIVAARQELTKPLNDAKQDIIDCFKPLQDECAQFEQSTKALMEAWDDEQERKRRIAQAEAEEKARKEQEALERRAEKAQEKGHHEKADELMEASEKVHAAPVAPAPAAKGRIAGRRHEVTVNNKVAFLCAALGVKVEDTHPNPQYLASVNIDDKKLSKLAAMMDGDWEVPGTSYRGGTKIGIRA